MAEEVLDDTGRADLQRRVQELEAENAALRGALESSRNRVENLNVALESARRIGVAVGILTRRGLTDDQAFELLRATSIHSGRKVRDIADEILRTGELPDRPAP